MDELKKRVLKHVDAVRDEACDLLAELVQTESVNPPGDTRAVMDVILRKARTFTDDCMIVAEDDTAPNVFISLNPGTRPQLLYNGHLDTVAVGRRDAWDVDPFGAVMKNHAMYGRGVADMKGGVGAMLMAAKALRLERVPLRGSLVLNFVSDEETGGARGARYLMEKGFYSPDMVVVGEITNRNGIAVGEKGVAVFSLSTKGRTAHASTPWAGVNAIDKMVKLLCRVQSRLQEAFKTRPSGYLPPATLNVGTIQGGLSFNVVADECTVVIDRRTLPGETTELAAAEIQDIMDEVKREDPDVDATLQLVASGDPFETSPGEFICRVAQSTLEELNLDSSLVGYEQVSDGRFFAAKGIPTILIGPGIAQQAHTPNEHLQLDQYAEAMRIYALLAMNALGV